MGRGVAAAGPAGKPGVNTAERRLGSVGRPQGVTVSRSRVGRCRSPPRSPPLGERGREERVGHETLSAEAHGGSSAPFLRPSPGRDQTLR